MTEQRLFYLEGSVTGKTSQCIPWRGLWEIFQTSMLAGSTTPVPDIRIKMEKMYILPKYYSYFSNDLYFRHFSWQVASLDQKIRKLPKYFLLQQTVGQSWGSYPRQGMDWELPTWTMLYISLVNVKLRVCLALIFECEGGDTEILKFDPSANHTWTYFSNMTTKEGNKLEVSTINCSLGK